MRFFVRILANAFALWVVTLIPVLTVTLTPFGEGLLWEQILSFLVVAALFAVVNTVIGSVVKLIALPLYFLTLGIIGFVINGFLLWLTAALTSWWHWGLSVESFWWAIVAAIIISLINSFAALILRPLRR